MEEKKNLLTYAGLKSLEDELHDLKVVKRKEVAEKSKKQESRVTCPRMLSMMLQRMSREISKQESKKSRRSLRTQRL